jgi:hypothetical protein
MQTAEMVAGVSRAGGRVLEPHESLVLGRGHGFEVGEHLVAELGAIHLGTEARELIPTPTPAGDEILADHVCAPTRTRKIEAPGVIHVVFRSRKSGNLVQLS